MTSSNSDRIWLITGCSTGFGRELARVVLEGGERAIITARAVETVRNLVEQHEERAIGLTLDVTDKSQIAKTLAIGLEAFGRIDVLVNNAGYGYFAALEEADEAETRALFETNFFGLMAVTQAVLPVMRRQRSGHIVNISSVSGLVSGPGIGPYNASKFAVEGLSEALALECRPLGIHVTAVEPGPFRTDFAGRSLHVPATAIDDYAATAGARRAMITGYSGKQAGDPVRAARAIVELVDAGEAAPANLILGRAGLEAWRAKAARFAGAVDHWESVTLSADFPAEPDLPD